MTQPIFLIGPRGCGKTTVGHALARARHFQFSDTDHRLQAHEQRTVAEIVQAEGWARFRELETLSLKAVTLPNTVIATGGGIILAECNRQFMRENGVVIYLQASVSALIDRLEAYPKVEQRPTLTGKPVREEVGEVLAQREALYRDAAHHIVDATASPDRVVEQIMTMLCGATAAPVS
ncbi:shikimate kinase AroL [Klebsiella quasipneumoniae]|uniref:shikimate kinase AroL n=1 Tax=Klebsiella quasipneumoniae TaxID=1463165 RepID=UPI000B41CA0A|nr:shikimate kinase AroL [Klebsiella quasipneumoniae]MDJ1030563.1 shikimate kinase AroL [Klebsiella quasipneumoniae]RNT47003.1 shikimate kinase AroL [Klebsiella quasipneumoniae subsp. quasipneumoniae]HBQ3015371.1 shikimate kinase AroL [Klebsiella quasipneumoniae subsp. quasipneumoniae]HBW1841873.1 shikimate kinase AroL [Klebsiella quasipneumoniae subsp. quasipneumoniae]HCM7673433.1 shikimate kinase AroL [Klebsiella quasipneumoniae subsp. quasipneumoniae]